MLAAGTQTTPLPDAPVTQETTAEWQEIALSVAPFLDGVQQELAGQVAAFDPEIAPYAEYALANQGKQLRATLTGLAANCAGGWNNSAVKAAVIIEMVHLATLLHDDIMDGAEFRRNRPTLARKWPSPLPRARSAPGRFFRTTIRATSRLARRSISKCSG